MHTQSLLDHHRNNRQSEKAEAEEEEAGSDARSGEYEQEHVHDVYQHIASHFSSTRYKVSYALRMSFIDVGPSLMRGTQAYD